VHDAGSANTGADLVIWGAETVPVLRNVALMLRSLSAV
jgi:hypothetical protein